MRHASARGRLTRASALRIARKSGHRLMRRLRRLRRRQLRGHSAGPRARKQDRIGGRPKVVVSSSSKIRRLAERGLSAVRIGAQLGVSRMTVTRRLAEA